MKTLADYKRRCKEAIGTDIQIERHLKNPAVYKTRVVEVTTVGCKVQIVGDDRVGYLEFGKASEWEFSENSAIRYTKEGERRKLVTITFI